MIVEWRQWNWVVRWSRVVGDIKSTMLVELGGKMFESGWWRVVQDGGDSQSTVIVELRSGCT